MVAAARYGLLFGVDPMAFLDRTPAEAELMVALYEAAARDMKEGASDGG